MQTKELSVLQRATFNHMLLALLEARQTLMLLPADEALKPAVQYGKSDTLMLDAIPEVTIRDHVGELGPEVILITEEAVSEKPWPGKPLCAMIADPTDRSKSFAEFVKQKSLGQEHVTIGEIFQRQKIVEEWCLSYGSPVSITGPMSSVTCMWEDGSIVFTILLNYLTCELTIVANDRVLMLDASHKKHIDLEVLLRNGKEVLFPSPKASTSNDYKRFVSYLGNDLYIQNFKDGMTLIDDPKQFVHYDAPGGPSRPLYLSELQQKPPVGLILANGEKLPEWIGWLAYVDAARNEQHGKGLCLFELSTNRPHMRDGVLMSTSVHYSLFSKQGDSYLIDILRLRHFPQPSQFRSMLVVVPSWNFPVLNALRGRNYREIIF